MSNSELPQRNREDTEVNNMVGIIPKDSKKVPRNCERRDGI
jgi:hypothetical protein